MPFRRDLMISLLSAMVAFMAGSDYRDVHSSLDYLQRKAQPILNSGLKVVHSVFATIAKPLDPPPRTAMVDYATVHSKDGSSSSKKNKQVVDAMQVVGMEKHRAVVSFTAKDHFVEEKVKKELLMQKVPENVAESIASGLGVDVRRLDHSSEEYSLSPSGHGMLYQVRLWVAPNAENPDEYLDVALILAGASFDAGKEVDHYEEEETPVFKRVPVVMTLTEPGLFGSYTRSIVEYTEKQVAIKIKKTPVFKQKVFTASVVEDMKRFLIREALGDVLQRYGPQAHPREIGF